MKRKVTERRKVARPVPRPPSRGAAGPPPSPLRTTWSWTWEVAVGPALCRNVLQECPGGSTSILKSPGRTQLSPVSCDLWRQNSTDGLLAGHTGHFLRSWSLLGPRCLRACPTSPASRAPRGLRSALCAQQPCPARHCTVPAFLGLTVPGVSPAPCECSVSLCWMKASRAGGLERSRHSRRVASMAPAFVRLSPAVRPSSAAVSPVLYPRDRQAAPPPPRPRRECEASDAPAALCGAPALLCATAPP